MLSLPHRAAERGFTLIELLITVAVLVVGLSLAAPNLSQQILNYRVRSAAEGMLHGLNFARTEAIRRNTPVSFTVTTGSSAWSVAQVSTAAVLAQRAAGESPGVTSTSVGSIWTLTFRPTGLVDTSAARLSQLTLTSQANNPDTRQIDVFGGGLIRMCNPNTGVADDPRRC